MESLREVPGYGLQAADSSSSASGGNPVQNLRLAVASTPIPIRLRGRTIGTVNVRFQGNETPEKTVEMIGQIADRLATALEYAQLLEETRVRAGRDALVNQITTRFRSTLNVEFVLRTAAEELQRAFKLKEAEVRVGVAQAAPELQGAEEPERKNGRRK